MRCPHCGVPIPMRPIRSALTDREWEVLALLVNGRRRSEVADDLCLSLTTIDSHTKRIRRKLGTRNTREVIRWAQAGGHD